MNIIPCDANHTNGLTERVPAVKKLPPGYEPRDAEGVDEQRYAEVGDGEVDHERVAQVAQLAVGEHGPDHQRVADRTEDGHRDRHG